MQIPVYCQNSLLSALTRDAFRYINARRWVPFSGVLASEKACFPHSHFINIKAISRNKYIWIHHCICTLSKSYMLILHLYLIWWNKAKLIHAFSASKTMWACYVNCIGIELFFAIWTDCWGSNARFDMKNNTHYEKANELET